MKNKDLLYKCFSVISSCKTIDQFKVAVRFVNLAAGIEQVQSDSYRVPNFFIPLERAMAVKEYKIRYDK